jgi:5,10-methylenetetrahydromethanopterin reductase
MKLWSLVTSSPRTAVHRAERAEAQGWAGLGVTDSQNLAGDAWVALTAMAAATDRLQLGTSVTNPITRHPAVTAAAAQSLAVIAGDRVTVGIGRGDSALAHLGRAPASVAVLEHYVRTLRAYLRGESVAFADLGFSEATAPDVSTLGLADTPGDSRLVWRRNDDPTVTVEVASTGPRVIGSAAVHADRVIFALADERRLAWGIETARAARAEAGLDPAGIEFGAYLNVGVHPDVAVARELIGGGLTTFARFSVMHGTVAGPVDAEQQAVMERLHSTYDMKRHTRADSEQARALTDGFVDSYAIVGPPDTCIERLKRIEALGISKAIIIGASAGSDRTQGRLAEDAMVADVLPAFGPGND